MPSPRPLMLGIRLEGNVRGTPLESLPGTKMMVGTLGGPEEMHIL